MRQFEWICNEHNHLHNRPPEPVDPIALNVVDIENAGRAYEAATYFGTRRWADPVWIEHMEVQRAVVDARLERRDQLLSPDVIAALPGISRKHAVEAAFTIAIKAYTAQKVLKTPSDLAILHHIAVRSDNKFGRCRDTALAIATFAGVARDTAEHRLGALFRAGFIGRHQEHGKPTAYWINYPAGILTKTGHYQSTAFAVVDAIIGPGRRVTGRPRKMESCPPEPQKLPATVTGTFRKSTGHCGRRFSNEVPATAAGTPEKVPATGRKGTGDGRRTSELPISELQNTAAAASRARETNEYVFQDEQPASVQPGITLTELEPRLDKALGSIDRTKAPGLLITQPVIAWIIAGADLHRDVLPTIARLAAKVSAKGGTISTWAYFNKAVEDAQRRRMQDAKAYAASVAAAAMVPGAVIDQAGSHVPPRRARQSGKPTFADFMAVDVGPDQ